jgi:hypothetical protein
MVIFEVVVACGAAGVIMEFDPGAFGAGCDGKGNSCIFAGQAGAARIAVPTLSASRILLHLIMF